MVGAGVFDPTLLDTLKIGKIRRGSSASSLAGDHCDQQLLARGKFGWAPVPAHLTGELGHPGREGHEGRVVGWALGVPRAK